MRSNHFLARCRGSNSCPPCLQLARVHSLLVDIAEKPTWRTKCCSLKRDFLLHPGTAAMQPCTWISGPNRLMADILSPASKAGIYIPWFITSTAGCDTCIRGYSNWLCWLLAPVCFGLVDSCVKLRKSCILLLSVLMGFVVFSLLCVDGSCWYGAWPRVQNETVMLR